MTDTNHVVLVGRLTKDLGTDERSFGYVANGQARANISIAVNRSKKNGDQWIDEVNYFDVTIWGKTAENLKPYLTKGKQIVVDGYLKQDRWKDQNGNNQSRIKIVAQSIQLLGGNQNQQDSTPRFQPVNNNQTMNNNQNPFVQNQSTSAQQYAGQNQPQNQQNGFVQEDLPYPEDIPF